jgi:hypothetical protein
MSGFRYFLRLPAEVRQVVLRVLLVPQFRSTKAHLTVMLRIQYDQVKQESLFTASPHHHICTDPQVYPQILLASRQIHQEGQQFLYGQNHFEIVYDSYYDPLLYRPARCSAVDIDELFDHCAFAMFLRQIGKWNVRQIEGLTHVGDAQIMSRWKDKSNNTLLQQMFEDFPALTNLQSLVLDLFSATTFLTELEDDMKFREAVLRATSALQQHCPALIYIYEGKCDSSRYLLFSRKPSTNYKLRITWWDRLYFPPGDPTVNSHLLNLLRPANDLQFIPLQVDVEQKTVIRTTG